MTTSVDRRRAVTESLSRWRTRDEKQKQQARLDVVVGRVVSSMAMENGLVSPAWIRQATRRA